MPIDMSSANSLPSERTGVSIVLGLDNRSTNSFDLSGLPIQGENTNKTWRSTYLSQGPPTLGAWLIFRST